MQSTECFESVTLSRSKEQSAVNELIELVRQSQIRIVDIKRHRDELVIVYRRLEGTRTID